VSRTAPFPLLILQRFSFQGSPSLPQSPCAIVFDLGPDMRTTDIPPLPGAVAGAIIVELTTQQIN